MALQERKHLAFTLKDTKTIVGKLERIAAFVIHVLMAFFYLVIFDVSFLMSLCHCNATSRLCSHGIPLPSHLSCVPWLVNKPAQYRITCPPFCCMHLLQHCSGLTCLRCTLVLQHAMMEAASCV